MTIIMQNPDQEALTDASTENPDRIAINSLVIHIATAMSKAGVGSRERGNTADRRKLEKAANS